MEERDPSEFFAESSPEDIQEFQLNELKEEVEKDYSNIKGLFYLIPVPACITNQQRNFEDVNDAYCRLYDYERDDLIHQPFTMVVPEAAREDMARRHDDFFEHQHEFSGYWDVVRQDGTTRRILANAAYVHDTFDGHPLKVTFVVDVTDIASAQENLRLTNALLSGKLEAQEIAQNLMVHDLRNPINNIISISEMLLKRDQSSENSRWIELIHQLAQRLERQVRSTADLAKMEAGKYTPKTVCFDVLTLIHQVIRAASSDAARKGLKIKVIHQGQPLEEQNSTLLLEADQFYIEQMITNLLVNAIEASPPEKELSIDITTESSLRIRMTNAGTIPREIRGHLFDKNVTQGKREGQGLGTHIARLIAQQHGGDIAFETSDERNQTTFTITLPLTDC